MNSVAQFPANLPAIAESGFPVSYEAAKRAIAECESPFECRTMADKAAAMVVYARMRDDTELQNRAVRLQAWASRRWGEIDKELYPDRRQQNLKQNVRNVGDDISVEQPKNALFEKRPAPTDGTTERQRVISRRLAAIPEPEFSRQVESLNPPTVTQLASQGTMKRVFDPEFKSSDSLWTDISCNETRAACQALDQFAAFCERHSPDGIQKAIGADEAKALRRLIGTASRWLRLLNDGLNADSD
jgi:hypothetical protein